MARGRAQRPSGGPRLEAAPKARRPRLRPTAAFIVQWRAWYGDRSRRHRGGSRRGRTRGRDRSRDAGHANASRASLRSWSACSRKYARRKPWSGRLRKQPEGRQRARRPNRPGVVRTGESGSRDRHRGAGPGEGARGPEGRPCPPAIGGTTMRR
jgi:hypothetical protein